MKYIIIILAALFFGCKSPEVIEEQKTPQENLLYIADQWAYKSVTKEDYIIKEDC